jgi:predicted alpha/beta hydrolase family esterase
MRLTAAHARAKGNHVWYPQFPNPDNPDPVEWQDLLRQESSMMDEVAGGEKIAVAHSLGTINWLFGAQNDLFNQPFDRILLVAIPDPAITATVDEMKRETLDFANPALKSGLARWTNQVTAVASDLDRWQPNGIAFYKNLEIKTEIIPGAGHFSLDDGWGRWTGLENWIDSGDSKDLLER